MKILGLIVGLLLISTIPIFAETTLRGPTATIAKEINRYGSDLVDLCQYAESKFEKRYCLREAQKITSSDYSEFLNSKTLKGLNDIIGKFSPDFKKIKNS